ncbi:MAG: RNA-guided endonuclease InsQ/TnpB family protein [Methanotrichaceae archaeon]
MRKIYSFRLYPSRSQLTKMDQILELCRWTYNETLAYRRDVWEKEQKTMTKYDTHSLLPGWKVKYPDLKNVYSQVLQNVQERVDLAFRAFFRRAKNGENPGYPRFKGKGRYDSFTYPQQGFKFKDDGKLYLSKIGDVRIKLHRSIEGEIKRLMIHKRQTGKWFASFSVDQDDPVVPFKDGSVIGINLGLTSFATLSNGEHIENPRFFRSEEKALAKAQRKLSKTENGSPDWIKTLKVIRRIHERITNKRSNFVHQLSRQLVDNFGFIAFEYLNVKNMPKNQYVAKSISDAAWRILVTTTQNKAAEAGSVVVLVDPKTTTRLCSRCGLKVPKTLSDQVHECPRCGLVMDRDENAAINILRLGLQSRDLHRLWRYRVSNL